MSPGDADATPYDDLRRIVVAKMAYDMRRDRGAWERMRVASFWTVVAATGKKGPKSPQALMPFEWDTARSAPRRSFKSKQDLPAHWKDTIERWDREDKLKSE